MSQIKIKSFVLGMVSTNCYLIINTETNEAIIVDPADRAEYIRMKLQEEQVKPVAILLTHGHFDHIMAVNDLKSMYQIPVYAHREEEDVLKQINLNMSTMIGTQFVTEADEYVRDQEELIIAGMKIVVYHTPGHTKGGACYYFPEEKFVISGDTLFRCSIGRTDFPTGSMSQLIRSVREKLFVLPDDVKVYPGHDSMTTIGDEKRMNPFF